MASPGPSDPSDAWHWTFDGSAVLFSNIRLQGYFSFFVASILTIGICLAERIITYQLDRRWAPGWARGSRFHFACLRASLYFFVSFLRLSFMLIAMTLHVGLLLVLLTSLSAGQFCIELKSYDPPDPYTEQAYRQPSNEASPLGRSRSKPKPDSIFIHPNHSNLHRAEAAALELGLAPARGGHSRDALLETRRDSNHFGLGEDSDSESDTR